MGGSPYRRPDQALMIGPFSSISTIFMSKNLLRMANQEQWRKAKETRDPADYDKAKEGGKTIGLFDAMCGVMRMLR